MKEVKEAAATNLAEEAAKRLGHLKKAAENARKRQLGISRAAQLEAEEAVKAEKGRVSAIQFFPFQQEGKCPTSMQLQEQGGEAGFGEIEFPIHMKDFEGGAEIAWRKLSSAERRFALELQMSKSTAKVVVNAKGAAAQKAYLAKVTSGTATGRRMAARRARIAAMRETLREYGMSKVMEECVPSLYKPTKAKSKTYQKKKAAKDAKNGKKLLKHKLKKNVKNLKKKHKGPHSKATNQALDAIKEMKRKTATAARNLAMEIYWLVYSQYSELEK